MGISRKLFGGCLDFHCAHVRPLLVEGFREQFECQTSVRRRTIQSQQLFPHRRLAKSKCQLVICFLRERVSPFALIFGVTH
jgi:hypothetical protein